MLIFRVFVVVVGFFAKQHRICHHVGVHSGANEIRWEILGLVSLFSTHPSIFLFARGIPPEYIKEKL